MSHAEDLLRIVSGAHALTRIAALRTSDDAPGTQWRALSVLRTEGPLRLGELAAATRTTQPGMTRLVGQMAESGLVIRGDDPSDSRATVVSATAAGCAALAAWRDELSTALEPLFSDLDDDDWEAVSRTARILTTRTAPQGATR